MASLCSSVSRSSMQASTSASGRHLRPSALPRPSLSRRRAALVRAHKVEVTYQGKTHNLEVPSDQTILEVALDQGIDLPHDCKLGVCMTCPAKLVSGEVDQTGSMLSDDVAEQGYTLLCVATPQSDCKVFVVSEAEILDEQLVAGEKMGVEKLDVAK